MAKDAKSGQDWSLLAVFGPVGLALVYWMVCGCGWVELLKAFDKLVVGLWLAFLSLFYLMTKRRSREAERLRNHLAGAKQVPNASYMADLRERQAQAQQAVYRTADDVEAAEKIITYVGIAAGLIKAAAFLLGGDV